MHALPAELCPDPLRSLQRSPRSHSWIKGREREGKERTGRKAVGKREGDRKRRGEIERWKFELTLRYLAYVAGFTDSTGSHSALCRPR